MGIPYWPTGEGVPGALQGVHQTILEGQGLVFSKDNKKSKNNPLEIAQMYWFKEEYGVQFELDKAMLSAIDTACGTIMNYWDESVPLELKVKSKLLAEFTYNGQNIVNKEESKQGSYRYLLCK